MKMIGKILVTIAVVLLVLYVVYYAGTQGWLEKTPLRSLDYEKLNFLSQDSVEQTKVLTERAKETGEHLQAVLGDKVEVDQETKDKALHEKTLEYARYLYCKQVVTEWEKE